MQDSLAQAKALLAQKTNSKEEDFNFVALKVPLQEALKKADKAVILVLKSGHHLVLSRQYVRRPHTPLNPEEGFQAHSLKEQYSGECYLLAPPSNIDKPLSLPRAMVNHFGYLKSLREFWGFYVEIGLSGLIINFVGLLLPLFSALVYDTVMGNHIHSTLWALVIGMALFSILDMLLRVMRTISLEKMAAKLDLQTSQKFWDTLSKSSFSRLAPVGYMLSNFRALVSAREFFSSQTLQLVSDFPFLLLYLALLFSLGGEIVWVPIGFATSLVIGYLIFHRPQHDYSLEMVNQNSKRVSLLSDILRGQEWLKKNQMSHHFGAAWRNEEEDYIALQTRSRFWQSVGSVWAGFHVTLSSVFVVTVGVYQVENLTMTMGGVIAASLLSSRFMTSMAGMAGIFSRYEELVIAQRNIDKGMVPEVEVEDQLPPRRLKGELYVQNISWRFSEQHAPVFTNLKFTIPAGQKVAIVGRSGCGKSSLLRCMNGLLVPTTGDVLWDGVKVQGHDIETIEKSIGYKAQDLFLFDGTLEENVVAALTLEDSAEHAFEIAGLNDAIKRGDISRDTVIHNSGVSLSGGQRQMVCIARSLAHHPKILLLDEPSNGLDEDSEKKMLQRLLAYAQDKTLIISTHSRFVIELMDRIIVLNEGKVVADATPQQVLKS